MSSLSNGEGAETRAVKRRQLKEAAEAGAACKLRFSTDFTGASGAVRLLEANPAILEAVSSGQRVYFTGSDDNEVMLCTATETRKLQKVRGDHR